MGILKSLAFLHWPVVLAVVAVFVVLRLRGARSLTWTLACWAGIYAFVRFGFATPIPFSVVQIYMGITTLALAAYVSSSATRREEFLAPLVALVNEPRLRPLLAAVLVLLPALAAANAFLGSRETLEAPGLRAHGPPCAARHDPVRRRKDDRPREGPEPAARARDEGPERLSGARRERAQDLLPELPLLPRRRDGRRRHVRARPQPDPDQLHRPRHDRAAAGVVPVLAHRQGRARACPPRAGPGTRRCRPGRSS